MTVYCCSVSLFNCESAPPTLSLNLSTPLCIRWELGLLGARWLLPEVVFFFSGTSSWSVHFQCRGGSSFKILRGNSLPNIRGQGGGGGGGWQDLFPTYKQCKYLIFKWGGGGGRYKFGVRMKLFLNSKILNCCNLFCLPLNFTFLNGYYKPGYVKQSITIKYPK